MGRREEIERIEDGLVGERHWYEKGEVTIKERPKDSMLFGKKEKTKKEKAKQKGTQKKKQNDIESYLEEEYGSEEFAEKIDFIRNKSTMKITEKTERMLERVVLGKMKDKTYDNPRKKQIVDSRQKVAEALSKAPETEEKKPLHDVYEGRKTENDKFMEKSLMIELFNEIDRDLAEITDRTYITTRPIVLNKE